MQVSPPLNPGAGAVARPTAAPPAAILRPGNSTFTAKPAPELLPDFAGLSTAAPENSRAQAAPAVAPDPPASPRPAVNLAAAPPMPGIFQTAQPASAGAEGPALAPAGPSHATAEPRQSGPPAESGRRLPSLSGRGAREAKSVPLPAPALPQQTFLALSVAPAEKPPAATLTPATLPDLAAQLRPHLLAGDQAPVELILTPDDLGGLRFRISHLGDGLAVALTAERPETLELLRRHVDQLVQELRQSGIAGASISFGRWDQQDGSGRHPAPPAPARPERPPADAAMQPTPLTPAAPPATRPHPSLQRHGLNLRL